MQLIPCPWCGDRDETEFHYGREAGVPSPADPTALTVAEWARYLFVRANPRFRLPADPDGFLAVDDHCRVLGLDAVYAAGDGTTFAIKQGGISKVVVTDNKSVVASCTSLGDIDGASTLNRLLLRDKARDAALSQLKAAGADLGATHVLTPVADIKWAGMDFKGVAYRC